MDLVGLQLADLDELLDLGDADLAALRGGDVEVAGRAAEDEVAGLVGLPGLDDREVGDDAVLHDVPAVAELARLLRLRHERRRAVLVELEREAALVDLGAEARGRVEGGDARTARAHALRERALGVELDLELAAEVHALEVLVLADVGSAHALDLLRLEEDAEAPVVDAGVVGVDGEVLGAVLLELLAHVVRGAAEAEAADGKGHAGLDVADGFLAGHDLVDASATSVTEHYYVIEICLFFKKLIFLFF